MNASASPLTFPSKLLIGGELVAGDGIAEPIINPASGEVVCSVHEASTEQIDSAITAAAERGEQGTVALMAIAGMQAPNWSLVRPNHLCYIVRALKQVGLEAEARMIAAEAVTFG